MMLQRSTDADFLNRVVNHPEVSRWMLGFKPPFDLSHLVNDPANIFLANEHGGFLFLKQEDYTYGVHTQFLPEGRGNSLRLARDAAFWMFTQSDALAIETYVPVDNVAARKLTIATGFSLWHSMEVNGRACELYFFTLKQWAKTLCQQPSH